MDSRTKDPNAALLPFAKDWTAYMQQAGTTIASSSWSAVPAGLTVGASSVDADGFIATVLLSGGSVGVTYTLTNRVVMANGATDDDSMAIDVEEK